jgi:hypothetical protein
MGTGKGEMYFLSRYPRTLPFGRADVVVGFNIDEFDMQALVPTTKVLLPTSYLIFDRIKKV